MKTIIIYNSQTGFTKRYAQWIAEETGADCLALSDAKKTDFTEYEAIIFGSWACAGGISKLAWFKTIWRNGRARSSSHFAWAQAPWKIRR